MFFCFKGLLPTIPPLDWLWLTRKELKMMTASCKNQLSEVKNSYTAVQEPLLQIHEKSVLIIQCQEAEQRGGGEF